MRTRFLLTAVLLAASAASAQDPMRASIVRVYATYQRPDYARPWDMRPHESVTGSGCIVEGSRILTNAHVVSDQTFLQVQRADLADKFVATVAAVSHELDLAVLEVEDERFFDGAFPLPIGPLPEVGDTVIALGFPKGGTRLAVTEGVVSRVERSFYSHSWFENLVVQIDAPINPGSSGGPVLGTSGLVGVAFQGGSGESVGYMVPTPVIEHFLEDIQDGQLDGTPVIAGEYQLLENSQLRRYYGMAENQSGVLMTKVAPAFDGDDQLRARDIVLGIDDLDIANDGTVEFRPGERIDFNYAIERHQLGDSVTLHLLRDDKLVDVELELSLAKQSYGHLVPRMRYDVRPSYVVYGGLIFAPLTSNYMSLLGEIPRDTPPHLVRYFFESRTAENADREEIVLLINVLPDQLNSGYEQFEDAVVEAVDGHRVNSLAHLAALLDSRNGEYHRILLEGSEVQIVLRHDEVDRRSAEILARYRVPEDRSPDLTTRQSSPSRHANTRSHTDASTIIAAR